MSGNLDRMVVNETALTGTFDVDLAFDPGSGGAASFSGQSPAASVFTAVSDLGLKLETASAPVDILVIDHVERPTED